MFKSLQKPSQNLHNTCDWQSTNQDLVEISKINKITLLKQVIYYTPKYLFNQPQTKIFHPCDWSIQNFQIGRYLGKGKYGHVYLARQKKHKMIVALKIITKKQIVNNDIVFQIRREIQIHSHLQHPNILKMYGYFYDEKKIYIIMEYAPCGELYKVLQNQGKFDQYKSAKTIYQMLQALKYLHEKNIIHRDIKPQNILISVDDEIKLTDFGWSIHVSDKNKRRRTFCGTPDYICPEIASKRDYDFRLDLWCLGVLTFELNAGEPPFHSIFDRKELCKKIKCSDFKYPEFFSPQLKNFISNLMRVRPQERMTTDVAQKHPWIRKYYLDIHQNQNKTTTNYSKYDQVQI